MIIIHIEHIYLIYCKMSVNDMTIRLERKGFVLVCDAMIKLIISLLIIQ